MRHTYYYNQGVVKIVILDKTAAPQKTSVYVKKFTLLKNSKSILKIVFLQP